MYQRASAGGGGGDWFFTAVVTAPVGASITITDGDEEIEATGTGDFVAIPVHNENSNYTITVVANGFTETDSFTTGSVSGDMDFFEFDYGKIVLAYDDEFKGLTLTVTNEAGTKTGTLTAPSDANTVDIYVPDTGRWDVSGEVSGMTFHANPVPNITSLSTPVSSNLAVIPNGETVLPTDDIQTWLLCADIKNKPYTTLDEVLADEGTLRHLLTDDNAIKYLKRSKSWINSGLVPKMLGDDIPRGRVTAQSVYSLNNNYLKWMAFNEDEDNGWLPLQTNSLPQWIQYEFDSPTMVKKIGMRFIHPSQSYTGIVKVQGSNDNFVSDIHDLADNLSVPYQIKTNKTLTLFDLSDVDEYKYYRVTWKSTNASGMTDGAGLKIQLYPEHEGITENAKAMELIGSYDYAADTLLADSDWEPAIANSEYWDSVLIGLVPIMTSNTTPKGECIGYAPTGTNIAPLYLVFSENSDASNSGYGTGSSATDNFVGTYIGYKFDEPVVLNKMRYGINFATASATGTVEVIASDDGTNWNVLKTDIPVAHGEYAKYLDFNNATAYLYYAIRLKTVSVNTNGFCLYRTNQFYGRTPAGAQSWLKAGGINKPYTTLEEILSDVETVGNLMASHDAVDYLVTAKEWISAITADEKAMEFIGANNYAADTLLGDSEWFRGITLSSYATKVFDESIPVMTSNNTPSGTVAASFSVYNNYYAYYACDDDASTFCLSSAAGSSGMNIEYTFADDGIIPAAIKARVSNMQNGAVYKVQGYDSSNNTWDDLASFTYDSTYLGTKIARSEISSKRYKKVRILFASGSGAPSAGWNVSIFQVYGRTPAAEGKLHIYSAANDAVYYIEDGQQVPLCTTEADGHKVIDKADLPNGRYKLYSTVAKDPDNLSNLFCKEVVVTDNTAAIAVMPDGALYWYGFKHDLEDSSTANGWVVPTGYTFKNPTWNTYDVTIDPNASNYVSAFGSKNKHSGRLKALSANTVGTGSYISADNSKNYDDVDGTGYYVSNDIATTLTKTVIGAIAKDKYAGAATKQQRAAKFSGFWHEMCNFFSAAEDDVYYLTPGGVQVPVCHTDKYGGARVDFSVFEPGEYTFYSSVADDPDDLSEKYHKTVYIDAYTDKVYLMPEGHIIYWYGYENNFTVKPNVVLNYGTLNSSVRNTNDVYGSTTTSGQQQFMMGTENRVYNVDRIKSIVSNTFNNDSSILQLSLHDSNVINDTAWHLGDRELIPRPVSDKQLISHDVTEYHDGYIWILGNTFSGYYSTLRLHAMWYTADDDLQEPNFFSAANDTVYYTSNGTDIVVAETNDYGKAKIDLSRIPTGVTLHSTIADDPDDLTAKYSKVFNGPNADGKFYLMPDKTFYWYGFTNRDLTGGWARGYGASTASVSALETDNIHTTMSGTNTITMCSNKKVPIDSSLTKLRTLWERPNSSSNAYSIVYIGNSGPATTSDFAQYGMIREANTTFTKKVSESDISSVAAGSYYVHTGVAGNSAPSENKTYAIWAE